MEIQTPILSPMAIISPRREDLQAVRGIATVLLLLFHLQPKLFTLGFVGVDMFFVLTGFFTATVLADEEFSLKTIQKFYLRRFKRVVPVYFISLLAVFLGSAYILLPEDKGQVLVDFRWALSLASNFQSFFEGKGFWEQVSSSRFLVDTWSLGVQFQFYLLAPLVFLASSRCSPPTRNLFFVALISVSLVFQLFTDSSLSHNLLPSRFWQFILGAMCCHKKEENNKILPETETILKKDGKKSDEDHSPSQRTFLIELGIMGMIVVVLFNPDRFLSESIMRLVSCTLTALMIRFPSTASFFTGDKFLASLGDISYSLYLVNWPIIAGAKYYFNITTFTFQETALVTGVVLSVAIVLHFSVEKPATCFPTSVSIVICAICPIVILVLGPYWSTCCRVEIPLNEEEVQSLRQALGLSYDFDNYDVLKS